MKALVALVLVLGLVACGSNDETGEADEGPVATEAAPSQAEDSDDDSTDDADELVLADTDVCDLVREGIDAFNLGELDETIEKFEEAIPLAEDLVDEQPSEETRILLDAVRYYAAIPAEDYIEDSQTSPEFLRFKEFTLAECAYTTPPDEATDPGIPA